MAGVTATLLYEDRRGPRKEFGLHKLVVACVKDRVGIEQWQLEKALDGRPMGSDWRLLCTCRDDAVDIASDGREIGALFDEDQIRGRLREHGVAIAADASEHEARQAIEQFIGSDKPVRVFLLRRNMESVIRAAVDCGVPDSRSKRKKPAPLERDLILGRAAKDKNRTLRDCILENVPTLATFVKWVTAQFSPSAS